MRVSEGIGLGNLGRQVMFNRPSYAPNLMPGYVPNDEPEDDEIPWRYALVDSKGNVITLLAREPASVAPGYRIRHTTPAEAATGIPSA